jgi:hypothetical protein
MVLLSTTHLPSEAWLMPYYTLFSLDQISPMLFSKCAFICMILRSHTSQLSSKFFATFMAPWTLVFYSDDPRWPSILLSTPILTGLPAQTHDAPHSATFSSWERILSPGLPRGSPSTLARVLMLSTASWPTVWLRRPGYATFSYSSTDLFTRAILSTATTSVWCTSPLTPV